MSLDQSIYAAKQEFEKSFLEQGFYEKQTADQRHLDLLLRLAAVQDGETVLDLGTGSGYLAFPLAELHRDATIIGLDIVTETLKRNTQRAGRQHLTNLTFCSYDGYRLPFADQQFDTIVTRYALHHFPDVRSCFYDLYRILKPGGKLVLSDPTPNENDSCQFADKFMQKKADGHVKFYRLQEYQKMLGDAGFRFVSNHPTSIRFPRKEAERYADLLAETDPAVRSGYHIQVQGDEIWITEQVLNLLFRKRDGAR